MADFAALVAFSTAMGFSIYLSLPVVLHKSIQSRSITLLNAVAIGILIFLLADLFANVAPSIYANPASPYVADPANAVAFVAAVAGTYLVLFGVEHRGRSGSLSPTATAIIVAGAIGFQNLTEGLVLGASWAAGAVSLSIVVFLGFFLQNVTEGFPITSPLFATVDRRVGAIAAIYLIGAIPTIVGGASGFFYNSSRLDLIFAALAIGAILYSLFPMLRIALRPAEPPQTTYGKQRLMYVGLLAGFLLGFLVNAI
jgi:zinc transporter, ZIP family